MADITLSLRLEGFAEFARALRKLPGEISGEILETALVAGAGIIREVAAAKAPRPAVRRRPHTLRLADSIKIIPAEQDAAHAVVYVGSKVTYAHLVEFGHQIVARGPTRGNLGTERPRGRKGRFTEVGGRRGELRRALRERRSAGAIGFVAARPFLRPSVDENREQIIRRIGQVLGREIESAFRRLVPRSRAA